MFINIDTVLNPRVKDFQEVKSAADGDVESDIDVESFLVSADFLDETSVVTLSKSLITFEEHYYLMGGFLFHVCVF